MFKITQFSVTECFLLLSQKLQMDTPPTPNIKIDTLWGTHNSQNHQLKDT